MSAPKAFQQWKKQLQHLNITHEHGCPESGKGFPLSECSCDCYEKAIFTAGYKAKAGIGRIGE